MAEIERLIQSSYQAQSKYGLMIKTLFFTGARVEEFVNIRVEDLHFESDPPQVHITHAKGQGGRYVPVLPSLAQELRTHLQGRLARLFIREQPAHALLEAYCASDHESVRALLCGHYQTSISTSTAPLCSDDSSRLRSSSD